MALTATTATTAIATTTQPNLVITTPTNPNVNNAISHSVTILQIVQDVSGLVAFPPVSLIAGALIQVLKLVDQLRRSRDEYIEFALAVYECIKAVTEEMASIPKGFIELEELNVTKQFKLFEAELLKMLGDVEKMMKKHWIKQLFSASGTREKLQNYQGKLNMALAMFTFRNTIVNRAHAEITANASSDDD